MAFRWEIEGPLHSGQGPGAGGLLAKLRKRSIPSSCDSEDEEHAAVMKALRDAGLEVESVTRKQTGQGTVIPSTSTASGMNTTEYVATRSAGGSLKVTTPNVSQQQLAKAAWKRATFAARLAVSSKPTKDSHLDATSSHSSVEMSELQHQRQVSFL